MIWYIRLAMLAAVVAALAYLHHHVYEQGYDARDVLAVKEMKAEKANEAAADAEASEKLAVANAKIDSLNITMSQTISQINTSHQQEISNAQAKIAAISADLHSTKLRLSIAVASGPVNSAGQNQGTGTVAGPGTESRAELSEPAAQFLTGLAAQCDANASQLNSVIDTYNALKEAVNAEATP